MVLGISIFILLFVVFVFWRFVMPVNPDHDITFYEEKICYNEQILRIVDSNYTCILNDTISINIGKGPYFISLSSIKVITYGSENFETFLKDKDFFDGKFPQANEARTLKIKSQNYVGASKIEVIPIIKIEKSEILCNSSIIELKKCEN